MAPVAERASANAERGASSISRWVEDNKNLAIALGLGTIAVGGAGVYYYLNGDKKSSRSKGIQKSDGLNEDSSEKATGSNGAGSNSAAAAAAKKKKGKKSKKSKDVGGSASNEGPSIDGPLLDEASEQDLMTLPEEDIKRLPEEVRLAYPYHKKSNAEA